MHWAYGAIVFGVSIDFAVIGVWGVGRVVQAIEGDAVDGGLGVAGVVKLGVLKPIAVIGTVACFYIAQAGKGIPTQVAIGPLLLSNELSIAIGTQGGRRDASAIS